MRSLESYLAEYAESHRNPRNVRIHNVCVPLIMWSLLGFLWTFRLTLDGLTGAHLVAFAGLVFYGFFQNTRLIFVVSVVLIFFFLTFSWVPQLRAVSVVIFVLAWIGQFYGHRLEGKRPSFSKDLLFLLIGPIAVIKKRRPGLF